MPSSHGLPHQPAVIVHVGQPKAASSSIQAALAARRDRLAEAGITYPSIRGSRDHNAAAADFILSRHDVMTAGSGHAAAVLSERRGEPGGWPMLVADVRASRQAIVSAEDLALLGHSDATRALADLTGGDPAAAAVVVVMRAVSVQLPSQYSQVALGAAVPSFETWARLRLRGLMASGPDSAESWMDPAVLPSTWRAAGEVRVVRLTNTQPERFEAELLAACGVDSVLQPPVLEFTNVRIPAAWVIAWQEHQASRGWGGSPVSLITRIRSAAKTGPDLPGAGGRFAVVGDAAALIDAAFPQAPADEGRSQQARAELGRLVSSGARLTIVEGVTPEELRWSVERCRAHLLEGSPGPGA